MCCVISFVMRCILGVVISLLMTLGFILMVVGAVLLWGLNSLLSSMYSLEAQIKEFLQKLSLDTNSKDVINLIASNASSIGAIAFGVGVVLIAFAVAMTVIMCFFSVKIILIVVVILLSGLVFGLIIMTLYYGTNPTATVMVPLQTYIQNGLINKYVGINAKNPESIVVNVIQIAVRCCGLTNYTDFNSAPNFNKSMTYNGNVINMSFPISCCNYNKDFTISDESLNACRNSQVPDKIGCWSKVAPSIETYLKYCFASMGVTIGVLIAVIALLIVFICCMDKVP